MARRRARARHHVSAGHARPTGDRRADVGAGLRLGSDDEGWSATYGLSGGGVPQDYESPPY